MAKDADEMYTKLLYLAGLYLYPYDNYDIEEADYMRLDNILASMYQTTNYHTRHIVTTIGPDCEDIVLRGTLLGKPINITDYIYRRMTIQGICCMFNYDRYVHKNLQNRAHITGTVIKDR